ncbi:hypothetical protein E3N88_42457 [Mikania micrantha]|uniref:Sulfotransferase n=1 Tax=Mikania micrantha TaxID=192012 RepID=A0A5N6LHN8_9ASTR|nr:hypothetical protein E3N88_42457 [Mikania micrantha]
MASSIDLQETLKPFHQRASDAEERLEKLEAAFAKTKVVVDPRNEELSNKVAELQRLLEDAKSEQLAEREKILKEMQRVTDENAKLRYRISSFYLCRNPKDVLVSMFHFANKLRDKSRGLMTIAEAFDLFSKGVMPTGPYWDHVKGYHKAENVLFLTYEDMKKDTVNNVKRLAKFVGHPFTEEEEADGAVQGIIRLCSFESLREVNKHGYLRDDIPNDAFFREGKVGDWTNHLTDEMSRILDEKTEEKFYGLDISCKSTS